MHITSKFYVMNIKCSKPGNVAKTNQLIPTDN